MSVDKALEDSGARKKDPVLECLKIVAGIDTEHVKLRRGDGFKERDTDIGDVLAGLDSLGPKQFVRAKKLLKKYESQLPPWLYLEAIDAEWKSYYKTEEKKSDSDVELPGWATVADAIKRKYRVRTIPELGTDKETIYYYNGQIYERAEEILKSEAHAIYVRSWTEILNRTTNQKVFETLESALRKGPSTGDINEVLNNIRRTTLSYEQMNPDSHIPFLNGLLNLKTRRLEPFTSDLFYTYQINATLLSRYVTLQDVPLFNSLLNTVFYEPDIPLALSYGAYAFRPDFPVHKILAVLGRERIGKGTFVRVIQGLMPKGSGSFSLSRILTGERFQFTGVEGKNLLVDSETKRKFRRGTVLDWSMFCNLFGGDTLSVEPKGREAHDYVSRAKGIVLGNLPFIPVDSPPAVSRILVIETRNERPKRVVPNLDEKILSNEGDLIATLLTQIMFKLEDREFMFPGQLTDDATADILDKLADPISNFVEEMTEFEEGTNTNVKDAVAAFTEWCDSKGIPPLKPQVFKKGFGRHYEKRPLGPHSEREYFYINCKIFDTETEVKVQSQIQVDPENDAPKTLKISVSGDRYRRDQHECTYIRVGKKIKNYDHKNDVNDHDVRVSALMLIPNKECTGEPKTKALGDYKSGINLQQEFPKKDTTQPSITNADPVKSNVPEQKNDHGEKTKNDQSGNYPEETLRNEIINIIIDKAPLTEFNTLTPKAIHDLLCVKLPGISLSAIYRICKEEYDKGTLSKHGPGYRYNGGDY